jgi:NAD(P)-dependent dehydrogenase (short-subunit alcohol dehydrogenase family)
MPEPASVERPTDRKAYIITGPTSGIGRLTALELAKHGAVVLVGRDRGKLEQVQKTIEQKGQHAASVVCELSDIASVQRAAAEIIALNLPIAGLLNNAGVFPMRATKNAVGSDMTFAANHLGPFALTEALAPHPPTAPTSSSSPPASRTPSASPPRLPGSAAALYLSGGERAWRVETRRFRTTGCGRLRHVEAVQSRHGHGVRP